MSDSSHQNASIKDAPNAPGGRKNNATAPNGAGAGPLALPVGGGLGDALSSPTGGPLGSKPEGFGLEGEDVKGSLKIHIKLNLEADIRIIAKVKGDIAIGLL